MSTTIWKGHVAFGMVSFPVRLCAAARSQTISFNQLHKHDHSRIKQVLYCQAEDKPVARSEVLKGYEYEKDRYVVFEEGEVERFAPPSVRIVQILDFVHAGDVDPIYLEASYYLLPEQAGEKPYTLLFEAMRRSGCMSIGKLTMHNREHIVLMRPGRFGLVLHTLYYEDEVRALDEFERTQPPFNRGSSSSLICLSKNCLLHSNR